MITKINEFLKVLQGNNSRIIKVDAKRIIEVKDIDAENRKGGDIYFVVNSGGTKDKEIHTFNAVFLDFDCGKDKNGNYKNLKEVGLYKQGIMSRVKEFELEPSYVIETRNGYHVYWLLDNNGTKVTVEQWRECMLLLINHFDSDPQVKNPSRLMRVPYTLWMKDKDNPFRVEMITATKKRYDIEEIIDCIIRQSIDSKSFDKEKDSFQSIHNKNIINILPYVSTENSKLIRDRQVNALENRLKAESNVFNTNNECIRYITHEIDIRAFLGIEVNGSKNFNCIFHNDKRPSANIIYPSINGEHLYVCNSNSCGFKGNIITCVEKLQGCSRLQAIEFIKQVYRLRVEESEWAIKSKAILDENIRIILVREWEDSMNEIHSIVRRYYSDLVTLTEIARNNIYTSEFADYKDNVIFFVSQKYMASLLNRAQSSVAVRLALFAYLKLIAKIDDDKVPARLKRTALEYAKSNNLKDTIQFYSIPSYGYKALKESTERAKLWKETGCTIKGMSQEMLYRTFGEEIANEVFPKRSKVMPTDKANQFKLLFEKHLLMMINERGYATEKDVLKRIYGIKVVKEIKEKRVLCQVLIQNNLIRIRSNKELKEKFNIKSKGYPFIIIKQSIDYCNCA